MFDAVCLDPRTADLPFRRSARDPDRFVGAPDARTVRDFDALADEARLVSIVRNANIASKHFGDLKYWLTDLAVTQLAHSQQNADAAKAQFDADLKAIAAVDPEGVATVGRQVDTLTGLARQAAEAYSSDESATGNQLMAEAQAQILDVDKEIEKIVDRLEQQAFDRRDQSIGTPAARSASRSLSASSRSGSPSVSPRSSCSRSMCRCGGSSAA